MPTLEASISGVGGSFEKIKVVSDRVFIVL